jgi:hypothetical protein
MVAAGGHFLLDILGLIPGYGIPFDAMNAIWYAKEGRPTLAAISLIGMVPLVGHASTIGKVGTNAIKILPKVSKASKMAPKVNLLRKGAKAGTAAYSKGPVGSSARFIENVAADVQIMFGLKSFRKNTMWKTIFKMLDEKDSAMGSYNDEIKGVIEKAGGDPSDPETQKILFQLAQHVGNDAKSGGGGEFSAGPGAAELTAASKETVMEFAPWLIKGMATAGAGTAALAGASAMSDGDEEVDAPDEEGGERAEEPKSISATEPKTDKSVAPEENSFASLAKMVSQGDEKQKNDIAGFFGNLLLNK